MFLITSFARNGQQFEIFNYINIVIFLLILVGVVLFFSYKIIQNINKPKKLWLSNIPNAVKILEQKRLTKNDCINLLAQSLTLPKEKDAEALFLRVYIYEKLSKELGKDKVEFLKRVIEIESFKSFFFKRIVLETRKSISEKTN